MKTREEIDEMFRQYESKWGKLGHTSILHPERNREEKTMSIMDNELYKFRQKVFNGKEANKVSHKSMVNVTELNRQYFEKVTTDGTLIHAQSPLYGEQRQHTKYYKREGEPGNYRYYYTKEEWDAAHKQKKNESAMEKVQRMHNEKEPNVKGMIKDGNVYEKGEDGKFHKTDKNWDEMRKQAIKEADNKIIDAAKEGGYEAAKKAIFDDDRMLEMFGQFEGGFENHGWELNDDDSITGMDDDDEKYFKKMETWLRSFKDSTGIDIYKNPDFQKSVMDEIRKRYNLMKNQAKEREDIKNGNKKYAAPAGVGKKSVSEETKETAKKAGENVGKAAKAGAAKSEFNKGLNDTITNEGSDATADYIINNSPEWKEMVKAYRQAVNDGYIKMYRDGGKTVKNKGSKEIRDKFDPIFEKFEAVMQEAAKNPDFDRKGVEKLLNNELDNVIIAATEDKYGVRDNTKKFEHSALMTNSAMGDEIVDEYKAFQEKVKRGKEKNRLAHTATISPAMLNARYEEELGKKGILIHQANYKYYNKIDLGNGNTRYFYTKAEWDAYQREKGSKTNTNQKLSEETLKQIEQQKQKKATYDKNAEAAKHEGDRWQKKEEDTNKTENVKKAQSGREAAEKAGQKAEQDRQAKEKKLQENIEKRDQFQNQADKIDKEIKESDKEQESKVKEKENRKKEVIQDYYKNNPDATSFSEDFNKTVEERGNSDFTVTVHPDGEMVIYSPNLDKQIKELESKYKEVQKFYESDNKKLKNGEYKDEYERRQLESDREHSRLLCLQAEQQIKELENKKQMLAYDEFDSVCRQMGINFDKYNLNEREGKYKSTN